MPLKVGANHTLVVCEDGVLQLQADGDLKIFRKGKIVEDEPLPEIKLKRIPFDIAFSPDGKLLATRGMDGILKLWNLTSRQPVARAAPSAQATTRSTTSARYSESSARVR